MNADPASPAECCISNRSMPTLLIVIPAYNEGSVIGDVVRQVRRIDPGLPYEVLVIDDGSADDTAEQAVLAGARAVSLIQNLGYGYALQTGYAVALEEGFDVVVQMDGDGQHAPESIPELLRPLLDGSCDVVIGSRGLSSRPYPMPFARRLGQRLFSWILYRMCGMRIQDPTSGFQALGRRALRLFTREDFPGDYPDADVLLYLRLHGLRIREAPALFHVNPRHTSMHGGLARPLYYIYKMLFSMFLVYLRHRRAAGRPGAGDPR